MPDASDIFVACPTRGQVRADTVMALQEIRDGRPGLRPVLYLSTRLSVCDGRNQIVREFLKSKCTHLVMLDDDIVPHPSILRMADLEHDIVAAPVLIIRHGLSVPFPNVFNSAPSGPGFVPVPDTFLHVDRGDLVECDGVGTGVICIARHVLEHPKLRMPFRHEWDDDGALTVSEDLTFCRRAKAAGFRVWADYSVFSDQIVNTAIGALAQKYGAAFCGATAPERRTRGGLYLP